MAEALNFDGKTYGLLVERINAEGELEFVSPEGEVHRPTKAQTMLLSNDFSDIASVSKYKNSIRATPYDAVNPREYVAEGCKKCGNKVVSFQLLGETKKKVRVCMCGHKW